MLKIASALFQSNKREKGRKPFQKVTLNIENAKGQSDHMNTVGSTNEFKSCRVDQNKTISFM